MNLFLLVWNYLKARPLNTVLNALLLALGVAVIVVLLLFTRQLQDKIASNARGIDLVVGAKGSPLQIILCNIFHIDFPTGNIRLAEAEKLARHRLVKTAIPLALGDSYEGYRIIGCPKSYPDLYQAELAQGKWYGSDFEAVIGATVARVRSLKPGDKFTSAHGLGSGGHAHEEHHFTITGILKPSGTVIDNLIFTSIESVWKVHELPVEAVDTTYQRSSLLVPSVAAGDTTKEITSLLIQYRSPMGAVQLPRQINQQTSMQAASPAFETARLFSIMGVGIDVLTAMAGVLIFISGLSIFIALYNSLKERRYDLAIMRTMGATRYRLVVTILLEGVALTLAGTITGLLTGHGVVGLVAASVEEIQKAGISGLVFYNTEWIILAGSLLLGVLCALVPSVQAYHTDISEVLAGN
jgi:putative ABC transport system permease protein